MDHSLDGRLISGGKSPYRIGAFEASEQAKGSIQGTF
jgi:hypothetical protein